MIDPGIRIDKSLGQETREEGTVLIGSEISANKASGKAAEPTGTRTGEKEGPPTEDDPFAKCG